MSGRDEVIQNFQQILDGIETPEGKIGFLKRAIQASIETTLAAKEAGIEHDSRL